MKWNDYKRMEKNGIYLSKRKEWNRVELTNLDGIMGCFKIKECKWMKINGNKIIKYYYYLDKKVSLYIPKVQPNVQPTCIKTCIFYHFLYGSQRFSPL